MARKASKKAGGAGAPPLLRSVADLRALAHPLRLRMMELFAESAKTTKQVAELLGEPPTRLYHHVDALERAGLLVLKETRQNRGAVEKWYQGVAQQLSSRSKNNSESRASRRAVAATVLEQAKQEIIAAKPGTEAALLARIVVAAPPAVIPDLRRRLMDTIQQIRTELSCDENTVPTEHERWALTLAFAPVTGPSAKGVRGPSRPKRARRSPSSERPD